MNKKLILEIVHWGAIGTSAAIAGYSAVAGQIGELPYAALALAAAHVINKFLVALDAGTPVLVAAASVEPDVAAVVATVSTIKK